MLDDSGLPTQLITLGVALVACGLGSISRADRVYRTAGLAIGVAQLCRYFLNGRIEGHQQAGDGEDNAADEKLRSRYGRPVGNGGNARDHNGFDLTRTD